MLKLQAELSVEEAHQAHIVLSRWEILPCKLIPRFYMIQNISKSIKMLEWQKDYITRNLDINYFKARIAWPHYCQSFNKVEFWELLMWPPWWAITSDNVSLRMLEISNKWFLLQEFYHRLTGKIINILQDFTNQDKCVWKIEKDTG